MMVEIDRMVMNDGKQFGEVRKHCMSEEPMVDWRLMNFYVHGMESIGRDGRWSQREFFLRLEGNGIE